MAVPGAPCRGSDSAGTAPHPPHGPLGPWCSLCLFLGLRENPAPGSHCTARAGALCLRGCHVDREAGPATSVSPRQDSYGESRTPWYPHISWDTLRYAPSAPGHAGETEAPDHSAAARWL